MKSNNALLGFVVGSAVGATLGILFAPDKGSETIKKIKSQGSDLGDDLKNKFEKLASKLSKQTLEVEKKADELIEDGKSTIAQINESIVEKV